MAAMATASRVKKSGNRKGLVRQGARIQSRVNAQNRRSLRRDNRLLADYDVEKHISEGESNVDSVQQEGQQISTTLQEESDYVVIRDSQNVTVTTTDTQASINLQAALQLAITLILSIAIGTSEQAESVSQDLLQRVQVTQETHLKMLISNSSDVTVDVTDTQAAANVQVLLQVLLALVAKLEIF